MSQEKFARRTFFQKSIGKVKEISLQVIDAGLKLKFKRKVIRPPGAIEEDQFLLTCTRCDDCLKACPYKAIHKISSFGDGIIFNTPFIDPYFEACRFCTDMPCINACSTGALRMDEKIAPIGIAVINKAHCLVTQGQYCDYCFNSCPNSLRAIAKDKDGLPVIDENVCVGCGKCAYICVSQSGRAIEIRP